MAVAARPRTKITVRVSNHLRFDERHLPVNVLREIRDALEFPNPEREQAIREKVAGAYSLPKVLKMWAPGMLPRGFAGQLQAGLGAHGISIDWTDDRVLVPVYTDRWKMVMLRDYQEIACTACEIAEQGIWQAPPASGKTVTMLELMRRVGQRSIVVTNKAEIAYQWRDRAKQFLGVDVGIVGDGNMDVRDITIALQQTLWSRYDELAEAGFWDMFGLVCLDECHHLPAATFMETIQRFSARFRFGVSGTPEKDPHMFPLMEAAIGPRFHVTPKEILVHAGIVAKPEVRVVKTNFTHEWWGTHTVKECARTGCNRRGYVHRNNYTEIVTALSEDDHRNGLIADNIAAQAGRAQLVLSKRLRHLDVLRELCIVRGMDPDRLVPFTGKQGGAERNEIANRAESGDIVLFSTVADEALDIPRLDTLHLVWPGNNVEITKQVVGRIERVHPAKETPIVFDYLDDGVSVLRSQFWRRWRGLYSPQRMQISGLDD
jgi:superfamily II DNA or RNA helicase